VSQDFIIKSFLASISDLTLSSYFFIASFLSNLYSSFIPNFSIFIEIIFTSLIGLFLSQVSTLAIFSIISSPFTTCQKTECLLSR